MEDDINILANGRQPHFLENGRQPQSLVNGRRPKYFGKWMTPTNLSKCKINSIF